MIGIQVAFFHVIKLLQITVPDVSCPSYTNKVTAVPGIWESFFYSFFFISLTQDHGKNEDSV